MKSNFNIIFLFLISLNLYSAAFDSDIKKARDMESKDTVKCNPTAKNGGIAPVLALKSLKPGMTLFLTPRVEELPDGEHFPPLVINNDKIIITSDEKINYPVVLKGEGCIIRNAYLSTLNLSKDAIVLDSIVKSIVVGEKDERIKLDIYNTVLRALRSGRGKLDVELKNCTVKGPIKCMSGLKLKISDSVLYNQEEVFLFYDYSNRKGRIILKDNIIYSNSGYGKMVYSESSRKKGVVCLDPKELKKLWSVTFQGENIFEVPKFEKHSYVLADDSPGKGKGIIAEEHPVLKLLKKKMEDARKNRAEKRMEERKAK